MCCARPRDPPGSEPSRRDTSSHLLTAPGHHKPCLRGTKNEPSERRAEGILARSDFDRTHVRVDREAGSEQKYGVISTTLDDVFAIIARKPNVRSRNRALGSHAEHFVRRSRTAIATRYFCSQCASSSDCENVGDKQAGRDRAQKLAREELRARRVARGASFLGLGEKCRSIGSPRLKSGQLQQHSDYYGCYLLTAALLTPHGSCAQ